MVSLSKSSGDFFKNGNNNSKGALPDALKQFYKNLKGSSNTKQLAFGTVTGMAAGYVASKFGKIAATAIGGSLLLLQIAKYNGYIEIDWSRLNQDMQVAKSKINQNKSSLPEVVEKVRHFASENIVITGGFASGFLLGFAFA